MRVQQMTSPKSGNPVANQFVINHNGKKYFQSYATIIAVKDEFGLITLNYDYWDYSRTTGKYRNEFLSENTAQTRAKIKSGEYKTAPDGLIKII